MVDTSSSGSGVCGAAALGGPRLLLHYYWESSAWESVAAVRRWESLGGLLNAAGAVSRLGALLMAPGRERLG